MERDRSLSLYCGHVGPVVAGAREQHVTEERLNWSLADEAHKKQLFDDWRGDNAQGRQAEEEASKAVRLAGVLVSYILLQSTLRLLLDALHVGDV